MAKVEPDYQSQHDDSDYLSFVKTAMKGQNRASFLYLSNLFGIFSKASVAVAEEIENDEDCEVAKLLLILFEQMKHA